MGMYSTLAIGNKEIMNWKYHFPDQDHPLMKFLFIKSDKKIVKYRYGYYCNYETKVSIAKKR